MRFKLIPLFIMIAILTSLFLTACTDTSDQGGSDSGGTSQNGSGDNNGDGGDQNGGDSQDPGNTDTGEDQEQGNEPTGNIVYNETPTVSVGNVDSDYITGKVTDYDVKAYYYDTDTTIVFSASSVAVTGSGASAAGTTVTITAGGTYVISGECNDGRLIVNTDALSKVHLVFNGLTLRNTTTSPVFIKSADKAVITVVENTVNTIEDPSVYTTDLEPNAALCAYVNLAINGKGTLNVIGNYNNGIDTNDTLKVVGAGTYNITAVKNGLKGNDSVIIMDGDITVSCGKDGVKSDKETDPLEGFIYVGGGTLRVTAGDDGFQAVTCIQFTGGRISINATGKDVNCVVVYGYTV